MSLEYLRVSTAIYQYPPMIHGVAMKRKKIWEMDKETKKDTRQRMQKKDNAPCNNQPIRAKDQPQKKKMGSKKGRPEEENFVKKQVSLSISKFETPIEC